jgi:hypothetical protein
VTLGKCPSFFISLDSFKISSNALKTDTGYAKIQKIFWIASIERKEGIGYELNCQNTDADGYKNGAAGIVRLVSYFVACDHGGINGDTMPFF